MLRMTLGWVDESGEPIKEQHEFSHRELEQAASVSHSRLPEAIQDALSSKFIRRVQRARVQRQGVKAKSAAYELCWDEHRYTDDPKEFEGFYLQPSYVDQEGQNRIGRKNIPNVFFDYLIKNENRGVIRTVSTLLWYSIDWGKGGERRQPVRKSLRDLVELTQLDKSSVVRALDEAEEKRYVERLERGVFDLSGKRESSTTVYGIRWTSEYTYTYEGLAVLSNRESERPQNATQPVQVNAPKIRHDQEGHTLPKCDTTCPSERSQNATRNAPKMRHDERSQNATKVTTNRSISKTLIPNNSSKASSENPSLAVVARQALLKAGFEQQVAQALAEAFPSDVILRQISFLPKRTPAKNPLGMLRRAIEENWATPEVETTDVCSSAGELFAAHFYAGYHGNTDVPVTKPSQADSRVGAEFVDRLLTIIPDPSQVAKWGQTFGQLVAHRHEKHRHAFPALRSAIQQHGDDFYVRLGDVHERETGSPRARS